MRCQECGPWSRKPDLKWLRRETTVCGKAAVQAPREENGPVNGVIMWQARSVEVGHENRVPAWGKDSRRASLRRLPIGAQDAILPHKRPAYWPMWNADISDPANAL